MNKIVLYAIGALVFTALVVGAFRAYKREVEIASQAAAQITQLQEAVRATKDAADELKKMTEEASQLRAQLIEQQRALQDRNDELEQDIIGPAQDRPSSQVLKDTVRSLEK